MTRKKLIATASIPLFALGLSTAYADTTKNYEFSSFNKVEAQEGLNVSVQPSDKFVVEAIADKSDLLDKLEIIQDGDHLIIKRKTDWGITGLIDWMNNWTDRVQINVLMPNLESAEASTGADLRIGAFNSEKLHLEVSTGADLIVSDITAGNLSVDATTGANLTVTGTCDMVVADASSGADIWAKDLVCEDGRVEAASGADVDVSISEKVKAEAWSGGTANIHGTPKTTEIEEGSGGKVNILR